MAEVLLAQQQGIAGFEKLVVIKRILPHLRDDGRFVQMFLNEARLAASLHHPNIVETYDVRRDETEFYIVMEYLSGEDLRFILRRARRDEFTIPVGVACRVIADAASGLHYAHTANDPQGNPLGIVHRDIGPTNVLLTYTGVTKLVDFGVAKANTHNIYTRPGTLKGKYAYCSPEQVQHKPLDPRSDVFSLGIVFYEMLTAKRLFRGSSPPEVLKAVMEQRIPPPSSLNQAIPPELDQVVLAALQRDRNKRTATAGEFRDQIERALQHARLNVGQHQVATWMQTVLQEQHEERTNLEQKVALEARNATALVTGDVPMAFTGTNLSTLPPSTNPSAVPATIETPGSSSSVSNGSLSGMSDVEQPRKRTALLMLLTSLGTLFAIGLLVFAFWLGRQGPGAISPAVIPLETGRTAAQPQESTLYIQANVDGATLVVDGKQHSTKLSGMTGILVPAAPNATVKLEVSKEGFETESKEVTAPSQGTSRVLFNLVQVTDALAEEALPEEPPAPEPPPPTAAKVTRRTPPRRPTRSRSRRAELVVKFTPVDAKVQVDGSRVSGTSPITLKNLNPGRVRLRLSADGYKTSERIVRLNAGRRASISIDLREAGPPMGTVSVQTVPVGATLQIDGQAMGRTPVSGLELEADQAHAVRITLEGYKPWSGRMTLETGRNAPMEVTLTPVAAAAPEPPPPAVAVAPPPAEPPPPAAPPPPATADFKIAPGESGSAVRGAPLTQSRCSKCHSGSAMKLANTKTAGQWERFLRYGSHARHGPLREHMSRAELLDVKSFLMENAADKAKNVGAGRR